MQPGGLRISRDISVNQIPWNRISEIVSRLYHQDLRQSTQQANSFKKELHKPLSIKWFQSQKIERQNNKIITAICEFYSADEIIINHQRSLRIGGVSLEYCQDIHFAPNLRRDNNLDESGKSTAHYSLSYLGKKIEICSVYKLLLVQLLLLTLLLVTYLAVGSLFLYTSSVFLLFIYNPFASTIAATSHGFFGLALLSFLVVMAALSGKAFRNLISLAINKGFFKKGCKYDSKVSTQSAIG